MNHDGTASARATDPATSHEAAVVAEGAGNAGTHRETCRAEVFRKPGQTSGEIARATGLDRHVVSRRLPEIQSIQKGQSRQCQALGSKQVTWWPARQANSRCRPHNNPANYVTREKVVYCRICGAYIGREPRK